MNGRLLYIAAAILALVGLGALFAASRIAEPARPPTSTEAALAAKFDGYTMGRLMPVRLEMPIGLADTSLAPTLGPSASKILTASMPVDNRNRERMRDMLLRLVLTAYRGDGTTLALAMHDQDISRNGQFRTTTSSQSGPSRHAALDDGKALVLIPADMGADLRHDILAKTADRLTVETGEKPTALVVFEYCLDDLSEEIAQAALKPDAPALPDAPGTVFATVMMAAVIDGARLFSTEYGYVEASLPNTESLQTFLSQIDDLVHVSSSNTLDVAGRDYKARTYGRITLEQVATLATRLGDIEDQKWRYSESLRGLADRVAREELNVSLRDEYKVPEAQRKQLIRAAQGNFDRNLSPDDVSFVREKFKTSYEDALKELEELLPFRGSCEWEFIRERLAISGNAGVREQMLFEGIDSIWADLTPHEESLLRGMIGFSLDSDYDIDLLTEDFIRFVDSDPSEIAKLLATKRDAILAELRKGSTKFLLCELQRLAPNLTSEQIKRAVGEKLLDRASYQVARYDGGIAGTEVGQILFLTDLLAKLIDMDFGGVYSAYFPDGTAGWFPSLYRTMPVHYEEQLDKAPGGRLWFGLSQDAFSTDGSEIHFASVATRVFALSRGSLSEERETQPNYLDEHFVDWFNREFDAFGAVEPSYDQLNQIVKWTLALDFARESGISPAGLTEVPFRTDLWFADWAKAFSNKGAEVWLNCFHVRGRYSDDIETMSVFHNGSSQAQDSWCNGELTDEKLLGWPYWGARGGVSLPRFKSAIKLRDGDLRHVDLGQAHLRAGLAAGLVAEDGLSTSLVKIPTYNYRVEATIEIVPDAAEVRVTRSAEPVKTDRTTGEFVSDPDAIVFNRGVSLETSFARSSETFDYSGAPFAESASVLRNGLVPVARIEAATAGDSAWVTIEARQQVILENIGRRLSRAWEPWDRSLLREPSVLAVYAHPEKGTYFQTADGWVRATTEGQTANAAGVELPEGAIARVSDSPGARDFFLPEIVTFHPASAEEVLQLVGRPDYGLTVVRTPRENGTAAIDIRGPPNQPPTGPPLGTASGAPAERPILIFMAEEADQTPGATARTMKAESGGLDPLVFEKVLKSLREQGDGGQLQLPVAAVPDAVLMARTDFNTAEKALLTPEANVPELYQKAFDGYLDAANAALLAGDTATARRLLHDIDRGFGKLTPGQSQRLGASRFEGDPRIDLPLELKRRIAMAIGRNDPKEAAKDIVEDLVARFARGDSQGAEAQLLILRQSFAEQTLAGLPGQPMGRRTDEGLHVEIACTLRGFDTSRLDLLDSELFYRSRSLAEAGVSSLTALPPNVIALTLDAPFAVTAQRLGLIAPDIIRPAGAGEFVPLQAKPRPTVAEAVETPEGRQALIDYVALMISAGGGGTGAVAAPAGSDDSPAAPEAEGQMDGSSIVLLTTEEDLERRPDAACARKARLEGAAER
jgi:hypothetical protein